MDTKLYNDILDELEKKFPEEFVVVGFPAKELKHEIVAAGMEHRKLMRQRKAKTLENSDDILSELAYMIIEFIEEEKDDKKFLTQEGYHKNLLMIDFETNEFYEADNRSGYYFHPL